MENLKSKVVVGLVGGSDLSKITEQMGGCADGECGMLAVTVSV